MALRWNNKNFQLWLFHLGEAYNFLNDPQIYIYIYIYRGWKNKGNPWRFQTNLF